MSSNQKGKVCIFDLQLLLHLHILFVFVLEFEIRVDIVQHLVVVYS